MNSQQNGNAVPAEAGPPPNQQAQESAAVPSSDEEQMKRFEEALKEADWGHQPC
jgi:hypothetical protein